MFSWSGYWLSAVCFWSGGCPVPGLRKAGETFRNLKTLVVYDLFMGFSFVMDNPTLFKALHTCEVVLNLWLCCFPPDYFLSMYIFLEFTVLRLDEHSGWSLARWARAEGLMFYRLESGCWYYPGQHLPFVYSHETWLTPIELAAHLKALHNFLRNCGQVFPILICTEWGPIFFRHFPHCQDQNSSLSSGSSSQLHSSCVFYKRAIYLMAQVVRENFEEIWTHNKHSTALLG